MDTGADYIQIEASLASYLGLSTAGAVTVPVRGATGTGAMPLITGVSVDIEGVRVSVDVVVGGAGPLLIGRTAILAAIEFGMDSAGWLYR